MEVALAVGSPFISAFLQVAFDRIASSRTFLDFFQGKKVIKLDEETLERLEITLETISVVLEDAEDKQWKSEGVRRWLGKLKDGVNRADDLLDELNTECLLFKIDYEFQHKQTEPDLKLTLNPAVIEGLIPNLKKVTDRLERFVNQIHALGLQNFNTKEKYPYRPPSSSVVDKSQIFGRDDEIEKLIQMVLSDGRDSEVSVKAITGMGGIGKTTLAQLIYDDERVKNRFKTRAWVCVSEEYDALRVTRALLMEVDSAVVDDKDDFNRVQVKLRDSLLKKKKKERFLIILDDMWHENYNDWHNLKNSLNHGSRGSKIIVTTRNQNVASMMQNEPFHHMQPIPEDASWDLFQTHAFDNGDHTSLHDFEKVGQEIVKKCKGLPLAIKTIGGALRPKRDINEWRDISNSEIWAAVGDILPALRLSYKHLPFHLKSCFAFCALFPKDIPFDKEEVVLLWMANDLVKPSTQKVGRDYFEELKSRSFFESVKGSKYVMHDLINDLARFVTGNTCIRLEDYQGADRHHSIQQKNELPLDFLHFSYLSTFPAISKRFSGLAQVHSLRTFLPIHQYQYKNHISTLFFSDILPRFKRLRALTLSQYSISNLPDSIGDLKHLRLLNLATTKIKTLPNAISKCLNLQTLILENCKELVELPEDMRLLINLQHLDVRGVGDPFIKEMATWLSIFKDIQNIYVVVDKIHGSVLEQLGKIQLSHSLNINGLEDAVTIEEAKMAGLQDKDCIENLSLEWSGNAECSHDELNKFVKLEPHKNIKKLSIKGYRGTRFPNWLGDSAFCNMESLNIEDCKNCFSLPPLGQLIALKKLDISGMDGISEIGNEFYGDASTSKPFQALEELIFSDMAEWAIWNTRSEIDFPSLKHFNISNCPKLVRDLPFDVTSLENVEMRGLPSLQYNQAVSTSTKKMMHADESKMCRSPRLSLLLHSSVIKKLVIGQGIDLQFPTSDSCNSYLESLRVDGCGGSSEPIPLFSFTKLQDLLIENWGGLNLFNGYHQTLTSLQSLKISNCNNIMSFPEGGLAAPNLKKLWVRSCSKMKSLPARMHTQLPLISHLLIVKCPEIECFPEGGLPSSLETLTIIKCSKMRICQTNWGLQTLPSLKEVSLNGFEDTLFPEEGLLPTSLQTLLIVDFSNLESVNENGLQHLSSLQTLWIGAGLNLKYLPRQKFSSSLSDMHIWDCPLVESFPEGLASSLSELLITNCPKLAGCIEREKGEDWPKVSHIPNIEIDRELIS